MPGWKRAIDVILCLLTLPFLVVVTVAMWFAMGCRFRSSVFFRQERVGYLGRSFNIYKIRTMHAGAATTAHQAHLAQLIRSNEPMQKMDARRDPRLIPGGWLLRASGLDELPQIINVLRGEMSLVGPRPCLAYEYQDYLPWQRERLRSVPGLTGLWQVSGKNRTTFNEMIRLDIEYAETKSLWLDLWILLYTVPALLIQIGDTRSARRHHTARVDHGKTRARPAGEVPAPQPWPAAAHGAQLMTPLETQNSSNP